MIVILFDHQTNKSQTLFDGLLDDTMRYFDFQSQKLNMGEWLFLGESDEAKDSGGEGVTIVRKFIHVKSEHRLDLIICGNLAKSVSKV